MVNSSILNWKPANGPISTRSHSRLNPNSAGRDRGSRRRIPSSVAAVYDLRQFSVAHISATVIDRRYRFSWREKGAWWSPRSSKPLSARSAGRDRFDSYPLRLTNAESGLRTAGYALPHSPSVIPSEAEESLIVRLEIDDRMPEETSSSSHPLLPLALQHAT